MMRDLPRAIRAKAMALAVVTAIGTVALGTVALGAVALGALAGCGQVQADGSTSRPLAIFPEPDRRPAPEIAGPLLTGGQLSITQLRGRVVVLNAFASWCPPCQEELPALVAAADRNPAVAFVALNVKDYPEPAAGTLAAVGADYPVIQDPTGLLLDRFAPTIPGGLPVTIFIDQQGNVAGRIIGVATEAMLQEAIRQLQVPGGPQVPSAAEGG